MANRTNHPKNWTEQQLDELRGLVAQNIGYTKIAAMFGKTRNSIIGMCYRERIRPPGKISLKPKPSKPRDPTIKRPVYRYKEPKVKITKFVHLLNLKQGQCPAIIGEAKNKICCGKDVVRGSYCADCAREFYAADKPYVYVARKV